MKKQLKQLVADYTPRALNINKPVVQLFVNEDGINTRYSLIHFPSFYFPQGKSGYSYDVKIYDQQGRQVVSKTIPVKKFGTKFIEIKDFGVEMPKFGIAVVKIKSNNPLQVEDTHLGMLTSHFYAIYESANMESIGVIHPQTRIKKPKKNPQSWTSNQVISTKNLKKIVSYQLNPTKANQSSNVSITTLEGNIIESQPNQIQAMGAAKNVWSNFKGNEYVTMHIDNLTTPNAKPLVFLHFEDGSFTVSHS